MWKPDGDPGANHIIYQMDPIWQNHMEGIWVSYDFAIGDDIYERLIFLVRITVGMRGNLMGLEDEQANQDLEGGGSKEWR